MSKLKELELLLTRGKITRRELMARVSAAGLAAVLSPAFLPISAKAATPQKGGRLRLGTAGGSTSDSLDPATLNDAMGIGLNWSLRNCLVEIDHKFNPIPELAESWVSTPDAMQWIFKLRKGVEFHNGKTLDSNDVISSINHHRGEKTKSPAKGILKPVKAIKADGKHTVIFTLEAGNADFPFLLSDYHLTIQPAGTTNFENGNGTGGYKLVKFEPGVRSLVKRNPNYWKEGRAHFDEVETICIVDVNSRTNALVTGQIDAMNRCELKTLHLLKRKPDIQILNIVGTRHLTIEMLADKAPYDNNDVRLALKYAIDREQILKTVLQGYGELGNDHPIGRIQRFYASELPQRKYNPDKVRYHLKKAGYESHTFKLVVSEAVPGAVDACVLYKEHAAKAGVNIEVVKLSPDGYYSVIETGKHHFWWNYWSGRATEDWMFSLTYAEDAPWNLTHWKNEQFNKLLKKARAELDNAKRRELYAEMQRILRNEGGTVIPVFSNWIEAATKKLKIDNPAGNWETDGLRYAERWSFA